MKLFALLFIVILSLIAPAAFAFEREQLLGNWSGGGIRNTIGEGHERIVSFSKSGDHLEITFRTVIYGNRNTKAPPRETVAGPYRIKELTSNRLIYVKDGNEYHVTIRLNESGLLEWGALVSEDNKKWSYAKETSYFLGGKKLVKQGIAKWTFNTDPFEVPVGEAKVQGLLAGHAYYIYEKLPSYNTGGLPQRSIRVMNLNEDGSLSEQFRMIWDKHGGPYFKGTFSKGTNLRSLTTEILRRIPEEN